MNFYFIVVAVCAFFFAVYGSYYILNGLYVEYEYTVTNSNITVDKVIGKSRRKMIMSVDLKKFNTLAKLKDVDINSNKYEKIFRASVTPDGDDVYAAEMHLDKFGGNCLLLFSPNEKTMDAMIPYLKNTIKISLRNSGVRIKGNSAQQTEDCEPQKPAVSVNKTADSAEKPKTQIENKASDNGKNNTENKSVNTEKSTEKSTANKKSKK